MSLITTIEHSVWIGASDATAEGVWWWVTGEQFWRGGAGGTVGADVLYANWANGQPDDFGGGQDVATIFGGAVIAPGVAGRWDDGGAGAGVGGGVFQRDGYIVAIDGAVVPEPSTLILFGTRALGLIAGGEGARRRRHRPRPSRGIRRGRFPPASVTRLGLQPPPAMQRRDQTDHAGTHQHD